MRTADGRSNPVKVIRETQGWQAQEAILLAMETGDWAQRHRDRALHSECAPRTFHLNALGHVVAGADDRQLVHRARDGREFPRLVDPPRNVAAGVEPTHGETDLDGLQVHRCRHRSDVTPPAIAQRAGARVVAEPTDRPGFKRQTMSSDAPAVLVHI